MNVQELLPITKAMYQQMSQLAWLMLAPMFLLSCVIEYVRETHNFPAFILLKKLILTIVLLSIFPEITGVISMISNELANKIGEHHAIDVLYTQLKAQTDPQLQLTKFPFLLNADANVAMLNYFSYAVVNLIKPIMVLSFHMLWSLNLILAPLVILCTLFQSAGHITVHLFRSMMEISCWKIVWQILAEMLIGLQFVKNPLNYFDAIGFNFFLSLMIVGTPFFVHALVSKGMSSASSVAAAGLSSIVTPKIVASKLIRSTLGRNTQTRGLDK